MNDKLKLSQIIEGYESGGYIEGDAFQSQFGHKISFDGGKITGLQNVPNNLDWEYVPYKSLLGVR